MSLSKCLPLTHLANKVEDKLCLLLTNTAKQEKYKKFLLEEFSLYNSCIMNTFLFSVEKQSREQFHLCSQQNEEISILMAIYLTHYELELFMSLSFESEKSFIKLFYFQH